MIGKHHQHESPRGLIRRGGSTALLAVGVVAALLSGCGGSSKPSYCSSLTNLETSIKALPSTDVVKNGTSGLKSAVDKVQTDAQAVASGAKSDFPDETTALTDSVDALENTVKQVSSSPSAATVTQVATQTAAVVRAGKGFQN